MDTEKIVNFTDLTVWQEGHSLVLMVYKVIDQFPRREMFCLTSQIIRAVTSITHNIAEGYGRQHGKEKVQFFYQSRGSLIELQDQLIIAKDLQYITDSQYTTLNDQTINVHKLLNGIIKSTKEKYV